MVKTQETTKLEVHGSKGADVKGLDLYWNSAFFIVMGREAAGQVLDMEAKSLNIYEWPDVFYLLKSEAIEWVEGRKK